MATRRRREKNQNSTNPKPKKEDTGSSLEIKSEPESGTESTDGSSYNNGSMSLDVLAAVAAQTLEREPKRQKATPKSAPKKINKRNFHSLEELSLEQIRMLSDKALVSMFAEMSSDEIKRLYTYSCCLLPGQCMAKFQSFGNESRARMNVKDHLLSHIGELLQDPQKSNTFTAEPIQARNKRIAAAKNPSSRKVKKPVGKAATTNVYLNKKGSRSPRFTEIKPAESRNLKRAASSVSESSGGESSEVQNDPKDEDFKPTKKVKKSKFIKNIPSENVTPKVAAPAPQEDEDSNSVDSEDLLGMTEDKEPKMKPLRPVEKVDVEKHDTETRIKENEQFILELLSRTQPYHDHCYTTVFGKRHARPEHYDYGDTDNIDEEQHTARTSGTRHKQQEVCLSVQGDNPQKTVTLRLNAGTVPTVNNVHIPIIRLARIPVASDGTPLVSAEEVVQEGEQSLVQDEALPPALAFTAQRPYPPMPKSDLARKGKVNIPEEEASTSDEEEPEADKQTPIRVGPIRGRKAVKAPRDTEAENEKKMALKYIRELRCRKKEEPTLVCKICKDKTFTATATLMYHYRSHAGIKPFVCLICNTTFTRQHSLNYHMLIHNNQSRFTCKDCGRKFRHPSHFKEHLRRHTGETPFHCLECPLRFKTRNTYKRHLRTRHGKLLTADGIQALPMSELALMRKLYKNSLHDYNMEDEEDELDVDDIDEIEQASHETEPIIVPNKLLELCQTASEQEPATSLSQAT